MSNINVEFKKRGFSNASRWNLNFKIYRWELCCDSCLNSLLAQSWRAVVHSYSLPSTSEKFRETLLLWTLHDCAFYAVAVIHDWRRCNWAQISRLNTTDAYDWPVKQSSVRQRLIENLFTVSLSSLRDLIIFFTCGLNIATKFSAAPFDI